jgi:TIR domain
MSRLADLPEIVGFFSYSRDDDRDSGGALSALRQRIQAELRGQLGVPSSMFRLWQDKEAIPSGTLWEQQIKAAIAQSAFFIPIITPTVVRSPHCKFELDSFLARELELGRSDLVFPILYIRVPELDDSGLRKSDPVLSIIAARQYLDWRNFRHRDPASPEVKQATEQFCAHICEALRRIWQSPEERRKQDQEAELRRAEEERERRETEDRRREAALAKAEAEKAKAEEARRRLETDTRPPAQAAKTDRGPATETPPQSAGLLADEGKDQSPRESEVDWKAAGIAAGIIAAVVAVIVIVWGWWFLVALFLWVLGAAAVIFVLQFSYGRRIAALLAVLLLISTVWDLWSGNCDALMVQSWPSFLEPLRRMCQRPDPSPMLINPNLIRPNPLPKQP